jgi:hypothetical protein
MAWLLGVLDRCYDRFVPLHRSYGDRGVCNEYVYTPKYYGELGNRGRVSLHGRELPRPLKVMEPRPTLGASWRNGGSTLRYLSSGQKHRKSYPEGRGKDYTEINPDFWPKGYAAQHVPEHDSHQSTYP